MLIALIGCGAFPSATDAQGRWIRVDPPASDSGGNGDSVAIAADAIWHQGNHVVAWVRTFFEEQSAFGATTDEMYEFDCEGLRRRVRIRWIDPDHAPVFLTTEWIPTVPRSPQRTLLRSACELAFVRQFRW